MIYTVIETRKDGTLDLLRGSVGTGRITLKWMMEEVLRNAKAEGKRVEVKEWKSINDAYELVRDHNRVIYNQKIAANKARHAEGIHPKPFGTSTR